MTFEFNSYQARLILRIDPYPEALLANEATKKTKISFGCFICFLLFASRCSH